MNVIFKDVGRWKWCEYGVDVCEVIILNFYVMLVGDVVRAMRESGFSFFSGDVCLVYEMLLMIDGV